MGSELSTTVWNYTVNIEANDGKMFQMSYHSLVEHILLLRRVIDHPAMRQNGPVLSYHIKDYRARMARGEMKNKDQQLKLPWPIEWIWHVHRLYPLNYLNDSKEQLPDGLVEKRALKISVHREKRIRLKMASSSKNIDPKFYPSIDLTDAVIRQTNFLKKFRKHFLYSYDLNQFTQSEFQNLIHDYVSFVKLARKGQLIVPTFDIDLIWHTHMRYPSDYAEFSIATCGFILDHNDSIEPSILTNTLQSTTDRWTQTCQSEYQKKTNEIYFSLPSHKRSPAVVPTPIHNKKRSSSPIRSIWTPTYVYTTAPCTDGNVGNGCDDKKDVKSYQWDRDNSY